MKILVTGGAGFIGSHLCYSLLKEGHEVTAYDNLLLGRKEFLKTCESFTQFKFVKSDLLKDPDLRLIVKSHDIVYHLAANSDISLGGQQTDLDLNYGVIATYNLLEAMRLSGVRRIVFSSSSAIYGEASIKPTPENYGPLLPVSLYGSSKLSAESLITAFAHNFDFQAWIYRFANIVGAPLTHGVIYDFINRLKQDSKTLKVLGNGTQKKSYLHVSDCIAGMLYGVQHSKEAVSVYNLASHNTTDVKFIAEEVIRQMGLNTKIEYGTEDRGWKGDVPHTWLDGSLFGKLGWKAKFESSEAVVHSISESLKDLSEHV